MEAAKRKTFWLVWIASAILLSLPAFASSVDVSLLKTRAELSAENGQNGIEPSTFRPANHVEIYDSFWGTASDSSVAPKSPVQIGPQDLTGKSASEIRQLAKDRGLVPHPTKPDKWMDPVTGKERLRIDPGHIDKQTGLPYKDPKAAVPHHHGYGPDGKTKIVDPMDGNPHFPTAPGK